jgi:hypothetical protein
MAITDSLDAAAAALVAENTTLQALVAQFESTIPKEALVADIIAGTADNLYISPAHFLAALDSSLATVLKAAIAACSAPPATTVYVNGSSGSDTNPGTLASPFATIQGVINYLSQYQANSVTINVAAGTYVIPAGEFAAYVSRCFIQNWNFVGAGATTCLINASATGAGGFYSAGPALTVSGFGVTSGFYAFDAAIGALLYLHDNNVTMLSGANAFGSANGSYMQLYGTWTVSGTGANVFSAGGGTLALGYHDIDTTSPLEMTFSATVTGNTAYANNGGVILAYAGYVTLSGAVTGSRFTASSNGIIATGGSGASFFPGTVAGTTNTGGQYS